MRYLLLLLGMLLFCGCSTVDERSEPVAIQTKIGKKYADIKVSQLLRIIDGDTFVADVDAYSDIVGKEIPIRLRGIDTPELRNKDPKIRKLAMLEKQRLENLLNNAKTIELRNIKRCKYFRIVADVYIDGVAILPLLNRNYITQ